MVSNYSITKVHNSGIGQDMIWFNLKICDMTREELETVMKVVEPMYVIRMREELAGHLAYGKEQTEMKRES